MSDPPVPTSPMPPRAAASLVRLRSGYRALATLTLNTIILFCAVNLLAWLLLRGSSQEEMPGALKYGMEVLSQVYPDLDATQIQQLIEETAGREYVYEALTQFREARVSGRYVNVADAGFRPVAEQAPWPPHEEDLVLFVFGGSTTFGYGLPDQQSIPSFLQQELRAANCGQQVAVYNFGRSNYYSAQERALFAVLARNGFVPDVAVFIDGLNDLLFGDTGPKFTARLSYLMAEGDVALSRRALTKLPLLQLLKRVVSEPEAPPSSTDQDSSHGETASRAGRAVERWQTNRRLVEGMAGALGVEVFFVWQPVPLWDYDLEFHPFAIEGEELLAGADRIRAGYAKAAGLGMALPAGEGALDPIVSTHGTQPAGEPPHVDPQTEHLAGSMFASNQDPSTLTERPPASQRTLWLGGIQNGRKEALYIDRVHYTADFSREIANHLARYMGPAICPEPTP